MFKNRFSYKILLIESAYWICVVLNWLLFRWVARFVVTFLRILEIEKFVSHSVCHFDNWGHHFLHLDLLDIVLKTIDDICNEMTYDSLRMSPFVSCQCLFDLVKGIWARNFKSSIISFGLFSDVVKLHVIMGEILGKLVFGKVWFSFHYTRSNLLIF